MLLYGDLETELAAKVNTYLTANALTAAMTAIEMPENENEMQAVMRGTVTKTIVMIGYNGGGYGDTIATNHVSQDETIGIRCIFMGPQNRGATGVYAMIRAVKLALLGYQPQNCFKRLVIKKYDLAEFQNFGVQSFIDFETATMAVMADETEEVLGSAFVNATYTETLLT